MNHLMERENESFIEKEIRKAMRLESEGYQLVELPETHDFPGLTYHKGNKQAHAIINGAGDTIAYLWFKVNKDGMLYLEMIEVLEKEEGHGTAIVRFLFQILDITLIFGGVLLEESMRAYWFWSSLGADLDVKNERELYARYREGDEVQFTLLRESVEIY